MNPSIVVVGEYGLTDLTQGILTDAADHSSGRQAFSVLLSRPMERSDHTSSVAAALTGVPLPLGVAVRAWAETDFPAIQTLSDAEGWPTPRTRPDAALDAWRRSWPALVATTETDVIAFVRALTDGEVTMFVPELLVAPAWQRQGIGRCLLDVCHGLYPHVRIELFATESSASYYAAHGFWPFPGYRKIYR